MFTSKRTFYLEWGDCDPAGILHFSRYFVFFDACTGSLFERAGLPWQELFPKYSLVGVPLVEANARFFAPTSFGETVVIESQVSEWGRSSFWVVHRLYSGDILACEGLEKRVWAVRAEGETKRMQSRAIPQEVIERLSRNSDS